jgi:hypothetical protein
MARIEAGRFPSGDEKKTARIEEPFEIDITAVRGKFMQEGLTT